MEIIKCPNCGGSNFLSISPTERKCSYCGCITTEKKEEPQQPAQPQIIQQQVIIQSDYDEEYYTQLKEKILKRLKLKRLIVAIPVLLMAFMYLYIIVSFGALFSKSDFIPSFLAALYLALCVANFTWKIKRMEAMTPKELYHEGKRNPKILKY